MNGVLVLEVELESRVALRNSSLAASTLDSAVSFRIVSISRSAPRYSNIPRSHASTFHPLHHVSP
jgi:hypothetical protein